MKTEKLQFVETPFAPVYDETSQNLILGSFPSVKSREQNFYYGNPKNRFWKILSVLYQEEIKEDVISRRNFLLRHHLAVYDVIFSCYIHGSMDSSICDAVPADISQILEHSKIREAIAKDHKNHIFVNGKKAEEYYKKYQEPITEIPAVCLPSTSPANAAWSFDKLLSVWAQVKV